MSYDYTIQRLEVITDEAQKSWLPFRDRVLKLVKEAGAVRMHEITKFAPCVNSWTQLAYVDRMVEVGDLREIHYGEVAGQHRIFVAVRA